MVLTLRQLQTNLAQDFSYKGLRNKYPCNRVQYDNKAKLIHISANDYVDEVQLAPADLKDLNAPIYSAVAVISQGKAEIRCAWRILHLENAIKQDQYENIVRNCRRVTLRGIPLSRQCAFVWSVDKGCWKVVSPSKIHYSFQSFSIVSKYLLPDLAYHMLEYETLQSLPVEFRNGVLIKRLNRRGLQEFMQPLLTYITNLHGNEVWRVGKVLNVSATLRESPQYSNIIHTLSETTCVLDGQSQVLWSWGALHSMFNTASTQSVLVTYESAEQTDVVMYRCKNYEYLQDLIQHPQIVSNFTRAAVLCNRIAKKANSTALQLLQMLHQEDLCMDQATAFPTPLSFDTPQNWCAYYALIAFSALSHIPRDQRNKHNAAFTDTMKTLMSLDVFRVPLLNSESREIASSYIDSLFNKFKFIPANELFQTFQNSGNWYTAHFRGLSFYTYHLQHGYRDFKKPATSKKDEISIVQWHEQSYIGGRLAEQE